MPIGNIANKRSKRTILVTGGTGYIGSHTCLELLQQGYDVVAIDNLANSSEESLKRVQEMTGKRLAFYKVNVCDAEALDKVFSTQEIHAVIHFAGLKAVGESTEIPLSYYHTNVTGTVMVLKAMVKYGVKNFIFSSSATVYGDSKTIPIPESAKIDPLSPYGKSKAFAEKVIEDCCKAHGLNALSLRYFNPVGAHASGRIGEDPKGIPNNLMPFVAHVAVGSRSEVNVFGSDYNTPDGTGVRDYIHVVDLAIGHVAALKKVECANGYQVFNLGTGCGYSVLEMIKAFEKASQTKIAHKKVKRRPGDVGTILADPSLANKELEWSATRGLDEMCADLWRWQSANPNGYEARN